MNTTNSRSKTIIVALAALVIEVGLGVAATESGSKALKGVKTAGSSTNDLSSITGFTPLASNEWNPFQEIRDMQAQMERSFNRMADEFRADSQFSMFRQTPGYALSLDVRDLKDHFEVHAFLPDAKTSDVNVSLPDNQTLKVEVGSQQSKISKQKDGSASVAEWGQYEQVVRLPAPVKTGRMNVERKDHELIITLPRA